MKIMATTSLAPSRLVHILFFAWFAFAAVSSATTSTTTLKRHAGFLYSRTRGRCTHQFWSSKGDQAAWPRMVPRGSTVSKVFGSRAVERYGSDVKLLESAGESEGGGGGGSVFDELLKQASAALLNSYARKGFRYPAWEVKTLLIQGLVSEDAAARIAGRFAIANDACTIY